MPSDQWSADECVEEYRCEGGGWPLAARTHALTVSNQRPFCDQAELPDLTFAIIIEETREA